MMSPRRYRLYGLTLQSPIALPCRRAPSRRRPDVRLLAGTPSQFRAARAAARRRPADWFRCQHLADGSTHLEWTDIFEFLVSPDGSRVLYRELAHATSESLHVHLLGHVLSFSLLARGCDPLHGTVVQTGRGAIAFVGDCGRGKSTLAAALLARGHRIVTDDVVVLRARQREWVVHPGIPRLKLAAEMADAVLGPGTPSTPMLHGALKRIVPLAASQAVAAAVPLKAIYVIADPDEASPPADVAIEPLSPRDAFLEVIRAAFNLVVVDRARCANQFALGTRLVAAVPVRRLAYPRDLSRLPEVCRAVLADAAER